MKQLYKKIKLVLVALIAMMGIIFSYTAPRVYATGNTDVDMTEVTVTPVSNVVYIGNSALNELTIQLKINSSHLFTEEDIENISLGGYCHSKKIENNVLELKYYHDGPIKTLTRTYSISICGEKFSFEVKEKAVKISGAGSSVIVKGKTKQLSVKGLPKTANKSEIKWKSSSPSVISVNSKGKIKAKKIGNAIITVSYKGNVIAEYFFNSLSSKMKKVYTYATKLHKKGTYSQSKRMQKNYYDCSSFVWRSYANAGIYIGSKTYAPTYEAIWEALKKSKSWTVKKSKKYKPQIGDIYENHSMIYDVHAAYQADGSMIYFVKDSMQSEEWGFANAPTTQKYARYKTN